MSRSPGSSTPLGTRLRWLRDFALIGAVTGFAAPAMYWWDRTPYLAACCVAGAVLGALLGLVLPPLLLGPLARWPFGVLLVLGLGVGAAWGGGTGLIGGMAGFGVHNPYSLVDLSAIAGAVAGALQLGWFWLPYTLRQARGKPTWPVVVAACVMSGGLGFASLLLISLG